MNRFGNQFNTDKAYQYTNADGSRYFSNPDGSKFYDPGRSGKGRKWYESPSGVRHYMDEEEQFKPEQRQYNTAAQDELDSDSDVTTPIYKNASAVPGLEQC
jgi:hypothetical protein